MKEILERLCLQVIGNDEEVPDILNGIGIYRGGVSRAIKCKNDLRKFQRKKLARLIKALKI